MRVYDAPVRRLRDQDGFRAWAAHERKGCLVRGHGEPHKDPTPLEDVHPRGVSVSERVRVWDDRIGSRECPYVGSRAFTRTHTCVM